jgi:hypothetical protein
MAQAGSAVRAASKLACARSYQNECIADIPSRKCRAHSSEPLTGNSIRPSPLDCAAELDVGELADALTGEAGGGEAE